MRAPAEVTFIESGIASVESEITSVGNGFTSNPAKSLQEREESDGSRIQKEKADDSTVSLPVIPASFFKNDPEYTHLFLEGFSIPGDSGADPKVKPTWVNDELVARGQRVGREYLTSLLFADILSLYFLFGGQAAVNPLIATGNSSTPETARRRYLSTTRRVLQWYYSDLWGDSPAAREVMLVRSMHTRVRKLLHSAPRDSLLKAVELSPIEAEVQQPLWLVLQDALQYKRNEALMPELYTDIQREYLSQTEMAGTQFAFFGLALECPKRLGMHGVTEEDLEALVHLWAAIGYQLGIEDRFNKCIGGLATARRAWSFYRDRIYVPWLAVADARWEHMSRCVAKGLKGTLAFIPSAEIAVWQLMRLNNLKEAEAEVRQLLTWKDCISCWFLHFAFEVVLKVTLIRRCVNNLVSRRLQWLYRVHLDSSKPVRIEIALSST